MKIIIKTYDDLKAFINHPKVSIENAYEATVAYISPIIVFTGENQKGYQSKAELLADLDNYIEIEKISIFPPFFLSQRHANFNIRDIYNTDENE